jgi:hypothetical protein
MPSTTPTLQTLGWLVCYDVNRTLGGIASMELHRRSLWARGWMTDEGHALFVAISRLTPGTNILAKWSQCDERWLDDGSQSSPGSCPRDETVSPCHHP